MMGNMASYFQCAAAGKSKQPSADLAMEISQSDRRFPIPVVSARNRALLSTQLSELDSSAAAAVHRSQCVRQGAGSCDSGPSSRQDVGSIPPSRSVAPSKSVVFCDTIDTSIRATVAIAPAQLCCASEGGAVASVLDIQGDPNALALAMLWLHRADKARAHPRCSNLTHATDRCRHHQMRQLPPSSSYLSNSQPSCPTR